jgi:hypothetical protein
LVVLQRTQVYRWRPAYLAPVFALLAAAAFLIAKPPVGDLWAARARESAAAHGVGLNYWFSWFGGTVPGHYSVLAPYLTKVVGVVVLGAIGTVAITPLCYRLVQGSEHPALATWSAAIASSFSLWSGRVPFALGSAAMLVALLFVRGNRRLPAALAGIGTTLLSPVSGAFLILGLTGLYLHDPSRRKTTLAAVGATGACLIGVAIYFGMPGPQTFRPSSAILTASAIGAMLLARPPAYLRSVLVISLVACPLLAVIPNGMGSNFERFAFICLPVAVVATARTWWPLTALVTAFALGCGVGGSIRDLTVAAQPMSAASYYIGLNKQLDHTPGLAAYRVEVVPDGTYVAAYALLGHALLARGYETQTDNKLNAVVNAPTLDPVTYKVWLDNNAVGYVAIGRKTIQSQPEYRLVRSGTLPYLTQVWSDHNWTLYRVTDPSPIAAPPAKVTEADQAGLTIDVPKGGSVALRIRWSRFLQVRGPRGIDTGLRPDGQGWTKLVAPRAGTYVVSG